MNVRASGQITKMHTRLGNPVEYFLALDKQAIPLNPLLGKKIRLFFTGVIRCLDSGKLINKSYNQGYSYESFMKLASCDACIMSPEKCHYYKGTCREPEWADHFCMEDHIIYLANTSGLKVGITRSTQVPNRWIDQGAVEALPIIRVKNRQQSGFLEVLFKNHMADKTNWRNMIKGEVPNVNLIVQRDLLLDECEQDIADLQEKFGKHAINIINGVEPVNITYPVKQYPAKIHSLNFDKEPLVEGILLGIKGQYLILDSGVINIRKFSAYYIDFDYD